MTHVAPDTSRTRSIIAIDLLRLGCAALVMFHHYAISFARAPSSATARLLAGLPVKENSTAWFGWVGVELFFVISGLVIANSAEGASAGGFLRRRALRLVPAAWLCASASFLVLTASAARSGLAHSWLLSIGFWPIGDQIDPSYWTLGIECMFYLSVTLVLLRNGNAQSIERLGLWIGSLSCGFWLFAANSGLLSSLFITYRPVQLSLLPHGCFFAAGMLAWGLLRQPATWRRAVPFTAFLLAGCVEIVAHGGERLRSLHLTASTLVPLAVFLAGIALILVSRRAQPWLARRIAPRVAATLGLMTYPLYLLHQEIGAAIVAILLRAGLSYWPATAFAAAIVLVVSWGVAVSLEPALRAVMIRATTRRRAVSPGHDLAPDTRPNASLPTG